MDFSEALKAMRMGSKIARYKWCGRIFFWAMSDERIKETRFNGRRPKPISKLHSEDILGTDWYIVM